VASVSYIGVSFPTHFYIGVESRPTECTDCYRVLQSVQSVTECTEYYRVLQSVTECTECYREQTWV